MWEFIDRLSSMYKPTGVDLGIFVTSSTLEPKYV